MRQSVKHDCLRTSLLPEGLNLSLYGIYTRASGPFRHNLRSLHNEECPPAGLLPQG